MTAAWLSFIAALAGFGLVSLTMARHAGAWPPDAGTPWRSPRGKALLRIAGALSLVASGAVALRDNPQLGAIHWSAYAMAAALIITGLHAYAERWAVRVVPIAVLVLLGSILLHGLNI